jgi:UDP-N-acetylglucosamine diphosphorylase/glucosamine-1-phosphate N-acetyltransferase
MIVRSGDISAICRMKIPCIGVFESDRPEEFGVVTVESDTVLDLVEKSLNPPGNLINAGVYLFNVDIFKKIDVLELSERGELELTDALRQYIDEGLLSVCRLSSWYDIGEPWNLLDANEIFMSGIGAKNEGTIEDFVTINGPVVIGAGSVIKSGTYIEGPCIFGKNCIVGPHAYIRPSTSIGDDCHIGHSSEIKNSVVMDGTKIPHFNYVGDSVIGSGCNFGAGSKIANLRHDRRNVKCLGRDTHRKKFGAVVGDNVQLGINCSVNVGTVIGSGVMAAPGSFLDGNIADKTKIEK